jgi:hypothetical protein
MSIQRIFLVFTLLCVCLISFVSCRRNLQIGAEEQSVLISIKPGHSDLNIIKNHSIQITPSVIVTVDGWRTAKYDDVNKYYFELSVIGKAKRDGLASEASLGYTKSQFKNLIEQSLESKLGSGYEVEILDFAGLGYSDGMARFK